MKFEIQCVYNWDKPDELLEEYPCLKNYEFEVVKKQTPYYTRIKDENGQPIKQLCFRELTRMTVSVDSLDRLMELVNDVGQSIIISKLGKDHAEFNIEIYDGYRE